MNPQKAIQKQRQRRQRGVRRKLFGTPKRPRLAVFRSLAHTYAQVIDDEQGITLAAANTRMPEVREKLQSTGNREAAAEVGKLIAEKATAAGVKKVRFDRRQYKFHGRVKALAEAARSNGLEF